MILVENYDSNGMFDGFCVQSINMISKIHYKTKYLDFMDKIIFKYNNFIFLKKHSNLI